MDEIWVIRGQDGSKGSAPVALGQATAHRSRLVRWEQPGPLFYFCLHHYPYPYHYHYHYPYHYPYPYYYPYHYYYYYHYPYYYP